MPVLVIGEAQRAQISQLKQLASTNVMKPEMMQHAAGTDIKAYRAMMGTLSLKLPVDYYITYSHELQPTLGLCHHISISVDRHNKMPSLEAIEMILREFGMQPLRKSASIWLEDIDETTKAVNVVQQC